jgi:SAM-dependent methyltransferase
MLPPHPSPDPLPAEVLIHYAAGLEQRRLDVDTGPLERVRTQEIIERHLPPQPAVVYDIGGGPGFYACWLARRGYRVHLLDAVALHVEQAREASQRQPEHPLAGVQVGDARQLPFPDASAEAVLLLGPLYHLTDRRDRLAAWREAGRVLKTDGVVLAAAISRFASTLDGLRLGLLVDPIFARLAERDLRDGQHRNPTDQPRYFTTAYFHRPEELQQEAEEAGLRHEATVGVEGPAWLVQDLPRQWQDPVYRERVMATLRAVEQEPSLLGVSAHLLALARK